MTEDAKRSISAAIKVIENTAEHCSWDAGDRETTAGFNDIALQISYIKLELDL